MKRGGMVLRKEYLVFGRRLAAWAAAGMNWGDGILKDEIVAAGQKVRPDNRLCEALGRAALTQDAWVTQSLASHFVKEVAKGNLHPVWMEDCDD